jgi:hypothetical protein
MLLLNKMEMGKNTLGQSLLEGYGRNKITNDKFIEKF